MVNSDVPLSLFHVGCSVLLRCVLLFRCRFVANHIGKIVTIHKHLNYAALFTHSQVIPIDIGIEEFIPITILINLL